MHIEIKREGGVQSVDNKTNFPIFTKIYGFSSIKTLFKMRFFYVLCILLVKILHVSKSHVMPPFFCFCFSFVEELSVAEYKVMRVIRG